MKRNQLWISLIIMLFVNTAMVGTSVYASGSTTVLSAPIIADKAKRPGSTFSINITIANVSEMWGYEFVLSYDTRVLTATSYSSHDPFTVAWPFEINDTAGYVAMANSMSMGELVGFSAVDPAPIARIDFEVDRRGSTMLDLHDTQLTNIYGEMIAHDLIDGFFANINVQAPDIPVTRVTRPEPYSGPSSGILSMPPGPYTAESEAPPRWRASVYLMNTVNATGVSGNTHVYKNYIHSNFSASQIMLARIRWLGGVPFDSEWLEVGYFQNRSGYYLYAASYIAGEYEENDTSTSPLTDHFLELFETSTETFEARINSNTVKTVTFSPDVGSERIYYAGGESANTTNSLRGHLWNLNYYDSNGVPHAWQQVEQEQDPPYAVGLSSPDDFYTSGGGVTGDVNGDGTVDIYDAGKIGAHWSSPPGPLVYDSNADINPVLVPNGCIDIYDAALMSSHWKETAG